MQLQENHSDYKIEHIREKYFRNDFNCYEWLVSIKQWIEDIKEYEDLNKIRERKKMLLSIHKKITRVLDSLELSDTLQEPTICLQIAIENELKALRIIPSNRPQDTYTIRLVNQLIMMYRDGSGKEPSCYRNDYTSQYHGEFYHFLEEILPVLKNFGITVSVKIESLSRYAAELIPQRREDKPYSHKISQIDQSLLQE